jgi:hypothetical protein
VIYPSIRIEGAILSPDILDRLEELPGQKPADFGLDSSRVKDEIARAWADAQDYWRIFQRKLEALRSESPATTETRQQWVMPLLGLLGYQIEYQARGAELNGKSYNISHRATNRAQTPVQIVGYREDAALDRRAANARMSAHGVVQEYLNLSEQLYGIATNGRVLRLLRDSSRLIKLSFVEFDLDRIFTDGLFTDFAILYRLLHATRLPLSNETAAESLIERYHQDSLDSGARIREGLSRAVETAILAFANGFLSHPANGELRSAITDGRLTPDAYYKHLLRLIYRLLFLMVIEERDLVFPKDQNNRRQRDLYREYYSIQRLRHLSEKRYLADPRKHDLWMALLSTFRLFEAQGPGAALGIGPLAGHLFSPSAIEPLIDATLANDVLLGCLRSLTLYEHPETDQPIRVNYAALNVEEFGSVYEGLLEYEPAFAVDGSHVEFEFHAGDERAATGSHYTPDDLVQPLIKHSLDYLIAERVKGQNPEAALLDLRVADIACGSGHILLAAARRIAAELAVVRTGEEQPSPTAYRAALRDVIRNCVYGVDYNPLAVELCKVALWLEAHVPGQPLNFLDHHIKCGNSIVGFVRREDLDLGVPDEAFATMPGDDKELVADLRKKNKRERKDRETGQHQLAPNVRRQLKDFVTKWDELAGLSEQTPQDIETKKMQFVALAQGPEAWTLEQVAAIPIAEFYIPKSLANERKLITDGEFRRYWEEGRTPQGEGTALAWATAREKRAFHWFLEFPDVMSRGGFDCILGNPPYMGGTDLRSRYGHAFAAYMPWAFAPAGLSDLVVYFVRRIYVLLRHGGMMSLITTNSIRDGRIREDGLAQLIRDSAEINMAVRAVKWPGRANVVVSLLSIYKGRWPGLRWLDGQLVDWISEYLDADRDSYEPRALLASENWIFEGTKFLGDGFLLDQMRKAQLIAASSRNANVIFPFVDGSSVTDYPDQRVGRWIINFGDLTEAEAKRYEEPFAIVKQFVKPVRDNDNRDQYRRLWWQFAEKRRGLGRGLENTDFIFATVATTKYLNFSRFPAKNVVFAQALKVFATGRWDLFSVVQCGIHEVWAQKRSGFMKQDLRYTPSKCFDTFPFPDGVWISSNPILAALGQRYHEHRKSLMLSLWLSLTDIYNLFHARELTPVLVQKVSKKSPEEAERGYHGLLELRRLHRDLDLAVRDAYNWQDLELGHDFHEVETLPENDRTRYTISPAARKEVLRLLLELNHKRAAEEAIAEAPTKSASRKSRRTRGMETQAVLVETVPPIPKMPDVVPALSFELQAPLLLLALLRASGSEASRIDLARAFALLSDPNLLSSHFAPAVAPEVVRWADRIHGRSFPAGTFANALTGFHVRGVVQIKAAGSQTIVSTTAATPSEDQIDPWFRFEASLALRAVANLKSTGLDALDSVLAAQDPIEPLEGAV